MPKDTSETLIPFKEDEDKKNLTDFLPKSHWSVPEAQSNSRSGCSEPPVSARRCCDEVEAVNNSIDNFLEVGFSPKKSIHRVLSPFRMVRPGKLLLFVEVYHFHSFRNRQQKGSFGYAFIDLCGKITQLDLNVIPGAGYHHSGGQNIAAYIPMFPVFYC